jgi:hypothetical protein
MSKALEHQKMFKKLKEHAKNVDCITINHEYFKIAFKNTKITYNKVMNFIDNNNLTIVDTAELVDNCYLCIAI